MSNDAVADTVAAPVAAQAAPAQAPGAVNPAAAAAAGAPGPNGAPHSSASLYVGNIHDVHEAQLFDIFQKVGNVMSIRVLRDIGTRRPLGYAYVNFYQMADAERALDSLNYSLVKGHPIRIMWSQRDPSLRKTGVGNIFIKNLDKSIDNRSLHDTFSTFGNILSSKVAVDEKGESRGYGYVHYELADSADKAIQRLNGMLIEGKKVVVTHHVSRKERESKAEELRKNFTNVYVKDLDKDVTDEELLALFEKFGTVTSHVVVKDAEAKSRGFGFVNFADHEAASKACDALNGTEVKSSKIYVARAQKKTERLQDLSRMWEARKQERNSKYQGVNLYVKNLDDTVDSDKFRQAFATFGTITSHKLAVDEKTKTPRGFGFVCFASSEEATRAVAEMNGQMLGNKPVYVALAQRKEERRQHLAAMHQQRVMMSGAGGVVPGMYPSQPVFYSNPMQLQQGRPQQQFLPMVRPRFPPGPHQAQQYPGQGPRAPYFGGNVYAGPGGVRPNGPRQGNAPSNRGPRLPQGQVPMGGNPYPNGGRLAIPPQQQQQVILNQQQQQQQRGAPRGAQPNAGYKSNRAPQNVQGPLSLDGLSGLPEEEARNVLGNKLFGLIQPQQPENASKITGMLLEGLDFGEILNLIENTAQLESQINEALKTIVAEKADAPVNA